MAKRPAQRPDSAAAPKQPARAAGPGRDPTLPTSDYRHKTAKRKNNPPAKIAAEGTVPAIPKARYAYSPHLAPVLRFDPTADADCAAAKVSALIEKAAKGPLSDSERAVLAEALANREPWLEWSTKREQHQRGMFEVDPVALHIHERVSAQAVMRIAARQDVTHSLFADPEQQYHEAVQFYRHDIDWTNRLILGDSLQVMSSLARREDLAGKVQMIYMDPPYGIKFASNFQPEVSKRDVKDRPEDLTREAEMVRAYRDTWHLGTHSYLSYLRDRLIVAKELLADTGSIFVQISSENLHRVRSLLDEVFGGANYVETIAYRTKNMTLGGTLLEGVFDYLVWYCKDKERIKYRRLYRATAAEGDSHWNRGLDVSGVPFTLSSEQVDNHQLVPEGTRLYQLAAMYPAGSFATGIYEFEFQGKRYFPPPGRSWKTPVNAIMRLVAAERLEPYAGGTTVRYILKLADYPVSPIINVWADTAPASDKRYVVQTAAKVIERCMLMTTEPGDLVLDPTCGSGTTAYVAEQWGRRWITADTSRVAVAIARQRLLTSKFDYYRTQTPDGQPNGNPGVGLRYKAVPHIMLKSIAQNANLDPIFAKHEPLLEAALEEANRQLRASLEAQPEVRAKMVAKFAAKAAREGLGALTDADDRRWLLPQTKPHMVAAELDRAFRAAGKKPPTEKQAKAVAERIPSPAAVGKSSVAKGEPGWEHWQVPFDTDADWTKGMQEAVAAYRAAWRAKMDEVNACIAANAEQEELVDQPEVVRGITRVSGPFTVEAVMPPAMSLDAPVDLGFGGEPEVLEEGFGLPRMVETQGDIEAKNALSYLKQMFDLLKQDGVRFLNNKQMQWSRLDALYESGSTTGGSGVHAEGRWMVAGNGGDKDPSGRATVAVAFGPQYGPVTAKMVEELIQAAGRAGYEDVVVAGFSFDGAASAVIDEAGGAAGGKGLRLAGGHYLRIHMAHIRPDVNPGMNGLLKEQPGSQLFTVFGQPRVKVEGPGGKGGGGAGGLPEGEYTAEMQGVDVYNPVDNTVLPTSAGKVAAWFLDSDYDGRTFCITQAFFPDRSAWEKLAKALGGSGAIDAERFEAFSGTVSLPFPKGKHGKVAVKVIDPRGNEVMKVVGL